jgi:site-specific DNA recombinase
MEEGLADILQGLQPAKGLFELAKAMLRDAWGMRLSFAHQEKETLQKQLHDVAGQIENLLDRIVEASNASVVQAYEARIDNLERKKIVLQERLDKTIPPKGRLEDCIELALGFLSNPWNIYKNGDFVMRQTVLRLAFAEPLKYSQNGVYGTPEFSFPFKFLGGFSGEKSEMVLQERIELSTSPLPRECSTTELLQRRGAGEIDAIAKRCKCLFGARWTLCLTRVMLKTKWTRRPNRPVMTSRQSPLPPPGGKSV